MRIWAQESRKIELEIERYGLWKLSRATLRFQEVLGYLWDFRVAERLWHAKFGGFQEFWLIFGVFRVASDLYVNISQKPKVLLQNLDARRDHWLIYNKLRDLIANWQELRNSRIYFPT
jgi:hypothetical protein